MQIKSQFIKFSIYSCINDYSSVNFNVTLEKWKQYSWLYENCLQCIIQYYCVIVDERCDYQNWQTSRILLGLYWMFYLQNRLRLVVRDVFAIGKWIFVKIDVRSHVIFSICIVFETFPEMNFATNEWHSDSVNAANIQNVLNQLCCNLR